MGGAGRSRLSRASPGDEDICYDLPPDGRFRADGQKERKKKKEKKRAEKEVSKIPKKEKRRLSSARETSAFPISSSRGPGGKRKEKGKKKKGKMFKLLRECGKKGGKRVLLKAIYPLFSLSCCGSAR